MSIPSQQGSSLPPLRQVALTYQVALEDVVVLDETNSTDNAVMGGYCDIYRSFTVKHVKAGQSFKMTLNGQKINLNLAPSRTINLAKKNKIADPTFIVAAETQLMTLYRFREDKTYYINAEVKGIAVPGTETSSSSSAVSSEASQTESSSTSSESLGITYTIGNAEPVAVDLASVIDASAFVMSPTIQEAYRLSIGAYQADETFRLYLNGQAIELTPINQAGNRISLVDGELRFNTSGNNGLIQISKYSESDRYYVYVSETK